MLLYDSPKSHLFLISIFAFVSIVGINLPSAICAALFLDVDNGVLNKGYSEQERLLVFGIVMATYSLSGLFGGAILGNLCDKVGRKKIFILSLIGFAVGYFLSAAGVFAKQLPIFMLGRIIIGFFSGIAFLAQAAVADISTNSMRQKNFYYFSIFYSLGFVIGPLAGGLLSDSSILKWFNTTTPFLFGGLMTALMVIPMLFMFTETTFFSHKASPTSSLFKGVFRDFFRIFTTNKAKITFISYFLFNLGWSLFAVFYPVYLIQKFNVQGTQLGVMFAYVALWQAGAQFAIGSLSKYWKFTLNISLFLTLLAFTVYWLGSIEQILPLAGMLTLIAIFFGGSFTFFSVLLTNLADAGNEGKFLGAGLSVAFLAQIISPMIPSAFFINDISITLSIAGICFFLAGMLLLQHKIIKGNQ